jgi:hypothetical protein
MKKTLTTLAAGCISLICMANGVRAQGNNNVIAFTNSKTFMKSLRMLDLLDNPFDSTATIAADLKTVHVKAVKDFKARFTSVMDEKWYNVSDGYMSYFKSGNLGNWAFYNKKGQWQYTLKFYNEDKLPRDIRAIVKSTYFDYAITVVEEVETINGLAYIVHLEDKSVIKNIIISSDGEMRVMEEFQKPTE